MATSNPFTLDDFRKQMAMIVEPSFLQKMMARLPGTGAMRDAMNDFDASEFKSLFGIIDAMTRDERQNSRLIDRSRGERIAAGAGCEPHQVAELVRQFEAMASVVKAMEGKGFRERRRLLDGQQANYRRNPFRDLDDGDEDTPPDEPPSPLPA